jgi:hypothetical protein|nr:hypothetical protein [uncultured Porphyromonas sp.]
MILLVFEGKKREPELFTAIERLGLFKPGRIICSFCSDIQSLYKRVKELEGGVEGTADMVQLLQRARKDDYDDPIHSVTSDDISEIYLFFDSDLHNSRYPLDKQRERLDELLSLLGDEEEYGKLYISYPMIEAVRYTRELPDAEFGGYCVSIPDCKSFKDRADKFSAYSSLDFLIPQDEGKKEDVRSNWSHLIRQHQSKAQRLCEVSGKERLTQRVLFQAQCNKHIIPRGEVAILASMPLFLYDYFSEAKRKELGFSLAD